MNNVRPCIYWFMGEKGFGLFHCFGKRTRKIGQTDYDGETVAIVENRYGAILEIYTKDIRLLDSERLMKDHYMFFGKEMVGDNNV